MAKKTTQLPFKEFRNAYHQDQIKKMDRLLDMATRMAGADQVMSGGIFKISAIQSTVEPVNVKWLYVNSKYLWSMVAGYLSTRYGDVKGHSLNKTKVKTMLDLINEFSNKDLPFWVIAEAVLMYSAVVEEDFKEYTINLEKAEAKYLPKKPLSKTMDDIFDKGLM